MNAMPAQSYLPSTRCERGLGSNLLLLFGLPPQARVLVLGRPLEFWCGLFDQARFLFRLEEAPGPGSYDLVLYHLGCADAEEPLAAQLLALRRLLAGNGRLLLFAANGCAPRNWLEVGSGAGKAAVTPCGWGDLRRVLVAAGFAPWREFRIVRDGARVTELAAPDSAFLEFPNRRHPWQHLARRWGLWPLFHDSCHFLLGAADFAATSLARAIGRQIATETGQDPGPPRLERIDLRQRGALVLFLDYPALGRQLVARIVSDPVTRATVRRNREFLLALHQAPELPEDLKRLLPRPLGEVFLDDRLVQVESLVPGLPAWKVKGGLLQRRIHPAALDFIWRLQDASCEVRNFSGELPAALFAPDLARLKACPAVPPELLRLAFATASSLCRTLAGKPGFLVAGHGDYGYGNILVDPASGALGGVIDWDTGRLRDLPGLDLLNLEVQRLRTVQGGDFLAAFVAATRCMLNRGSLGPDGTYRRRFGIGAAELHMLCHAGLLRYAARAAAYPEVLTEEAPAYLQAFGYLREVAPL